MHFASTGIGATFQGYCPVVGDCKIDTRELAVYAQRFQGYCPVVGDCKYTGLLTGGSRAMGFRDIAPW